MKAPSILLAFALVGTIFTGCTKEAAKTTSSHFISATYSGGGSFSATGSGVECGGAAGAKISISGQNSSGELFRIFINPYSGATGTLAMTYAMIGCQHTTSSGVTKVSASGTITLTSTTPDVIGSFSYTTTDGSTYTGTFNAPAPTP